VLEAKAQVGGAVKTEYPYAKVPGLGQSTGAYLLGVMPPELVKRLGLSISMLRRDPHYFLPTLGSSHLLLGSDKAAEKQQFERFFSRADWRAHVALQAELASFREDLRSCWLQVLLSHYMRARTCCLCHGLILVACANMLVCR
jgi:phytoene dehydrogenase-like protein